VFPCRLSCIHGEDPVDGASGQEKCFPAKRSPGQSQQMTNMLSQCAAIKEPNTKRRYFLRQRHSSDAIRLKIGTGDNKVSYPEKLSCDRCLSQFARFASQASSTWLYKWIRVMRNLRRLRRYIFTEDRKDHEENLFDVRGQHRGYLFKRQVEGAEQRRRIIFTEEVQSRKGQ
jgi:hypothetical protein